MADAFDPYHRWLAIPASERPIHFYRLLGVPLFEDDIDVISVAADRQMMHVKTFSTGKYADVSQRILNELSHAKICLTNFETKLNYDAELQQLLRGGGDSQLDDPTADGLYAEMGRLPKSPAKKHGTVSSNRSREIKSASTSASLRVPKRVAIENEFPIAKIVGGLLVLLLGLFVVGFVVRGVTGRSTKSNTSSSDDYTEVDDAESTMITDVASRSLSRFNLQIHLRHQPTITQSGNHYIVKTIAFRDGDLVECELEYWREDAADGSTWRLTKLIAGGDVLHESP